MSASMIEYYGLKCIRMRAKLEQLNELKSALHKIDTMLVMLIILILILILI